jgi:hypothetical protein
MKQRLYEIVTANAVASIMAREGRKRMPKANERFGSSKFERFVRSYGVELLAARLTLHTSAIYHWLRGSTSPHPANAIMIQNLAKERHVTLSLDEIYQHFREGGSECYAASSPKPKPVHPAVASMGFRRGVRSTARLSIPRPRALLEHPPKTPLDVVRL